MPKTSRFAGYFDVDDWPLAFLQADYPYLSVERVTCSDGLSGVAYRQHRTSAAALAQANRNPDTVLAVRFSMGRWEEL